MQSSTIIACAFCAALLSGAASAQACPASAQREYRYEWERIINESPVLDYSYHTWDGIPYYSETFDKAFERTPTEYPNL